MATPRMAERMCMAWLDPGPDACGVFIVAATEDTAMLNAHRRPNRLEIDGNSVTQRVAALRRQVGPNVKIFAALKTNGYGFGTEPMARAALTRKADKLSLIDRAEAISLRQARIDAPILLYADAPIDADA